MIEDVYNGPVSDRARTLAILGSVALFFLVFYLIRKGKLKTGYSILWFATVLAIFTISVSEKALLVFSDLTGVYYAPSIVFSVLIIVTILVVIHFSVLLTKSVEQIKDLAQDNAILKKRIEKLERRNK